MSRPAIGLSLLLAAVLAAPLPGSARSTDGQHDDLPEASALAGSSATPPIWATPDGPAAVVTAPPAGRRAEPAQLSSPNPLWAIPLSALSETRERPIFSASRRPRPAAVSPVAQSKPLPPRPREPERPQLSLVGTIAGGNESFAIFIEASKAALRLRLGEEYQGWTLRAVDGREATLEKDQQAAVLSLPQPGKAGEVRILPASELKLISAGGPVSLRGRRER